MKKLSVVMLAIMICSLLAGCGSSSKNAAMDGAYRENMKVEEMVESAVTKGEAGLSSDSAAPQVENVGRKLIKTVEMTVETKDYDTMLGGLNEKIKACGGYVERMNTYNGSIYTGRSYNRNASMTIRIPENQLDGFLAELTNISNVVRRSDMVKDVTLAYVDLNSHKEALVTEQTRLLELLKKASSVEDIITIENRLSDVRYQIESMESQLRTYDNQIAYSTVQLEINEVKELTPVKEETVWERISGGFVDSLTSVKEGFVEIVIWITVNSPFLVIWAIVIFVLVFLLRKNWLKKKAKRAAMKVSLDIIGRETAENEGEKKE